MLHARQTGAWRRRVRPFIAVFLIPVLALAITAFRTDAAPRDAAYERGDYCLGCHAAKGLTKVFRNREEIPVFVAAGELAGSAHAALLCTDCHRGVPLEKHPGRDIGSRKEFLKELNVGCRTCHADELLTRKANHAYTLKDPDALLCTGCHGGHAVRRVALWKSSLGGRAYCLVCHSRPITKTHASGEVLSLTVDPANLSASVHNRHDCGDCHEGYTRETHQVREFSGSREHTVAVSGVCRKCHADKVALLKGSMHYNLSFSAGETLVARGNQAAPVCTDCHGFHAVGARATYETLSGVPCRKCHEDIFQIYAGSVHGRAKARGEHRAPLCSSCHFAHEIGFTAVSEKMRAVCVGCHKGVEQRHAKWLPNAALHLGAVACAACHAPSSEKGIYLRLVDDRTGEPVTRERMLGILGASGEELAGRLDAHGEGLNAAELSYLVRQLNAYGGGAKVTSIGRMDVAKYSEAHRLSLKGSAVRECGDCHAKDSAFFKRVTLAVVRTEGGVERYPTRPGMLSSVVSALDTRRFYVLGATRMTLLDWAGAGIVACGILFPVAHGAVRLLTAPRKRRKKDPVKREEAGP